MSSFIPETAPFDEQQRAWLNGFFSGLMGLQATKSQAADSREFAQHGSVVQAGFDAAVSAGLLNGSTDVAVADPEEDFPWHDSSLSMAQRMELAEKAPIERRLMAAMAQLDCGSCGYVCQSYAEAIAAGEEKNVTLCSPGGKETKQMIKLLLKDGSPATPAAGSTPAPTGFHRKNPFAARLLESRPLNKQGSKKDTRHVVIDLTGSGLQYEVGDALGVYPVNCRELASQIVTRLGADPLTRVRTPASDDKPLIDALCYDCCLRDPSDELLELLADRIDDTAARQKIAKLINDGVPAGFDILDTLLISPQVPVTATEVIETLAPLNPRLYSIAGSMKQVGQSVHLTVGKVVYERDGRTRIGVASGLLVERLEIGQTVRVFVQPNHGGFTVPKDDHAPMIMVGPGTGIAPFIAFLQERQARGADGGNWLFFGDQHRSTDFLYEQELQDFVQAGILSRLDTAFSRDGDTKIYVQDRMRQNAAALWDWINQGGYFYVCGDASRMAADVERTLVEIIRDQGAMSESDAKQFLKSLAAEGRYLRDVY